MSDRCENCRFWKLSGDGPAAAAGLCRRYAPRPSNDTAFTQWPFVKKGEWCGEFVSKPERG